MLVSLASDGRVPKKSRLQNHHINRVSKKKKHFVKNNLTMTTIHSILRHSQMHSQRKRKPYYSERSTSSLLSFIREGESNDRNSASATTEEAAAGRLGSAAAAFAAALPLTRRLVPFLGFTRVRNEHSVSRFSSG